jgi:2-methylaconitate cis-trans-isomerase PrpF
MSAIATAARAPRFDVNYLGRQIGLAIAVKHTPYAAFAWELLAVVGPFAFVVGLRRNRWARVR